MRMKKPQDHAWSLQWNCKEWWHHSLFFPTSKPNVTENIFLIHHCILGRTMHDMRCWVKTYRLEDEKAGEEIEDRVESGGKNCGNLMVRGKCDCHHPIICEVEEREEHDEYVPKELGHTPLQIDHGKCDQWIHYGLNQTVRYLNQNLQPTQPRKDSQKQTENFILDCTGKICRN